MQRRHYPGEIALLTAIFVASLAIALWTKASFGLGGLVTISYLLSFLFPGLSLGVWSYLFHGMLLIVLIICTRKFRLEYIFCFVVGMVNGYAIDFFMFFFVSNLPADPFILKIIYFVAGFILASFGVAFLLKCNLPILAPDTFVKYMAEYTKIGYKNFKIGADVSALIICSVVSLSVFGEFLGVVGIGTLILAIFFGPSVSYICTLLDRYFFFDLHFKSLYIFTKEFNLSNKTQKTETGSAPAVPSNETSGEASPIHDDFFNQNEKGKNPAPSSDPDTAASNPNIDI